jgi:ceramide glucosyltransferase
MLTSAFYIFLLLSICPFLYLLIALYSAWDFFRISRHWSPTSDFTPPVSILKPVRGIDVEAYENFASFCRQDYPEYEIVFCVGGTEDPVLPVIERLQLDFPERSIRVLYGSGRSAANDKVAKLARLSSEAKYEHLVISDSDVRVGPDYLKKIVAPLAAASIGAVTCLYVSIDDGNVVEQLQSIGMISDFYAGLLVARKLDGVKFALGPSIATTRTRLAEFGGYQKIENQPADDLLVGRLISERGYEIQLSPYTVETVADYASISDLMQKRMRWLVVMRHMRPWGHLGLLFTNPLPWVVLNLAVCPSISMAAAFIIAYVSMRLALTWMIGGWGLKRADTWRKLFLVPLWDAAAFCMWVASFARNTVRWRGGEYLIRDGMLVPAASSSGR